MTRERVLVVEDEIIVAEELREDLERFGYEVPAVLSSGDEVVETVARLRPDLLLMDIRIEGSVDGIEAAFQAKAEFGVPVVYLTAYSDPETLSRAAATRPAAYLLKPFNERELAANLRMAIAASKAEPTADASLRSNEPIVDALRSPALLAGLDGRIVYANGAALSALKVYSLERLRGEHVARFVDFGEGGEQERSRNVIAADGSTFSASVRIEPLSLREGGQIGVLAIFDEMSDRERALLGQSVISINALLAGLLPRAEAAAPAFDLAGFLLASPSGSGDLYDVFAAGRHLVACAFDVMGHGAFSSLVAYSLHHLVRTVTLDCLEAGATAAVGGAADEDGMGPAELLAHVNRAFLGLKLGARPVFVTMILCLLDPADGSFRLARAGHPPAILLSGARAPLVFMPEGGVLGVVEELVVAESGGVLGPGDRLVFLSDGVMDGVIGKGGRGGSVEGSVAFLEACRPEPLQEFVASVESLVSGNAPDDDASFLVLERRPPAAG